LPLGYFDEGPELLVINPRKSFEGAILNFGVGGMSAAGMGPT
jgi:hypothetical protein